MLLRSVIFCAVGFFPFLGAFGQLREVKITDNWEGYREVKKFYDADYNVVDSLRGESYCIEKREKGKLPKGVRFYYSMEGILEYVDCYSNLDTDELHGTSQEYNEEEILVRIFSYKHDLLSGPFKEFYDDGKLRYEGVYRDELLTDTLKTYYQDGKFRRKDIYLSGNLVSGNCFTNTGQDTTYFPFKVEASFPGGNAALQKWINENVKYPEVSMDMNEQGKVYLTFVVEEDGSVTDIKVVKGVSAELDNEAKRVIQAMPNWMPGASDGYTEKTRCEIPVVFKLEDEKPKKRRGRQ